MKKIVRYLVIFLLSVIVIFVIFIALLAEKDIPVEQLKTKYCTAASQFMPLMGMQVHYRDEGIPTDTLPLVLLHGMSSSLNTWDSIVYFMKDKKRLISLDLPAFGLTGPNPENEYSFDYYTRFLDSFLLRLGVHRCIVVGNSLGGGIAWHFTSRYPEKVKQLILIDASGYPVTNAKGSLGFTIASTPIINNLLLYITPRSLVRKSLQGIYYNQQRVTDAQVERFHDVAISKGNRAAALAIFKKGFEKDPQKIKHIRTSTLIIWGDHDGLIPVSNAFLFQKDIPSSRLEILKDVGHVPMEEAPQLTARIIASFVQ